MATVMTASNFQKATQQISKLSHMLANDLMFRKQFEDALSANPNVRVSQMRDALTQNGITYPFKIAFNAPSANNPGVQVWAPVMDPANKVRTNVGFTFRILTGQGADGEEGIAPQIDTMSTLLNSFQLPFSTSKNNFETRRLARD